MLTRHHVDGISKMPVVVIEVFLEVSTDADAGLKTCRVLAGAFPWVILHHVVLVLQPSYISLC